jgi:hypothetical protein
MEVDMGWPKPGRKSLKATMIGAVLATITAGMVAAAPQPALAQVPSVGGIPCTSSGTTIDCVGYNSNTVYMNLHINADDATLYNASLFVWNPYDGRSMDVWFLESSDGSIWVVGTDSQLGPIDFYSGWVSTIYPAGNPFSAAVQAPVTYVGGSWGGYIGDDPYNYCGRHPCFDPGPH